MSERYLRRHRVILTRPVESWHAWRYWRKFGRGAHIDAVRRDRCCDRHHYTCAASFDDYPPTPCCPACPARGVTEGDESR